LLQVINLSSFLPPEALMGFALTKSPLLRLSYILLSLSPMGEWSPLLKWLIMGQVFLGENPGSVIY
jgi:hypothetical protein